MERYRRTYGCNMGNPIGGTMPRGRNMAPYRNDDYSGCCDNVARYAPEDVCDNAPCGKRDGENFEHGFLEHFPIGMCYVPWQCFGKLYEDEFVALAEGTIFKELDLEFYGRSCK